MKRQGELKNIILEVEKKEDNTLVIAKDIKIFIIIKFLYLNLNKAFIIIH